MDTINSDKSMPEEPSKDVTHKYNPETGKAEPVE